MARPIDPKVVDLDAEVEMLDEPGPEQWRVMVGFGEESRVSFAELLTLYRSGAINDQTLIWGEGMVSWQRLAEMAERDRRFAVFSPDDLTVVHPIGPPPGLSMPEVGTAPARRMQRPGFQKAPVGAGTASWGRPAPWESAPPPTVPYQRSQAAQEEPRLPVAPASSVAPERPAPPAPSPRSQPEVPVPPPASSSTAARVAWLVGCLLVLVVVLHRHDVLGVILAPLGLGGVDNSLAQVPLIGANESDTPRGVRQLVEQASPRSAAPAKASKPGASSPDQPQR